VSNKEQCQSGSDADLPVEYAMEAISHAGTVLAVASKEGIAMAAEKVSHLPHPMSFNSDDTESHWKAP